MRSKFRVSQQSIVIRVSKNTRDWEITVKILVEIIVKMIGLLKSSFFRNSEHMKYEVKVSHTPRNRNSTRDKDENLRSVLSLIV